MRGILYKGTLCASCELVTRRRPTHACNTRVIKPSPWRDLIDIFLSLLVSAFDAVLLSSLRATSDIAAGATATAPISQSRPTDGAAGDTQHDANHPRPGVVAFAFAFVLARSESVDAYDGANATELRHRAFPARSGAEWSGGRRRGRYRTNARNDRSSKQFRSRYAGILHFIRYLPLSCLTFNYVQSGYSAFSFH